jgi:nitrogen-specific signal transduction histidine kinase
VVRDTLAGVVRENARRDMTDRTFSGEADAAALAVLAHGLLNSVGAVRGAAELLQRRGTGETDEIDAKCLAMILEQAQCIAGVLQDLIRGLPAETEDVDAVIARVMTNGPRPDQTDPD